MDHILVLFAVEFNVSSVAVAEGVRAKGSNFIWQTFNSFHLNKILQILLQEIQMEPQDKDKRYIKSTKKWKDFKLDPNIVDALRDMNKNKPTKVQQQSLNIALNPDRKKFNLLLRAINGSGKTLAFLLPMVNALEPGLKTAEDKNFRGKVLPNQIFRPQGIIIIQNILLQTQLNHYLNDFNDYGEGRGIDKLKFKTGKLNNDGHEHGDIIICMAKSFFNRHTRGNMKLDQCKFVAIDEIDDIYHHDKDTLTKVLEIVRDSPANLISTSATMQKKFKEFYGSIDPDYIAKDLNLEMSKETGQTITLEGVANFCHSLPTDESSKVHEFVLKQVFKELYKNTEKIKQQVFIFFNSVNQIEQFNKLFDTMAGDFTTDQSEYLKDISKATLAAKIFKDGKKVDMPINEKESILTRFKNNEINVLLCTNIMARGIDIRNAVFVINIGAPKISSKDDDIDVDIYLHRVGRTGRHNDKGVALTISHKKQIEFMQERVKHVHKIDIKPMQSVQQIIREVFIAFEGNIEEAPKDKK